MEDGYVVYLHNFTTTPLDFNTSRITLADLTKLNNASILSISAYSILLFFGLIGNLVVFLTLLKSRYRKSSRVNKLILHLAVADLLVCCFTIPIEIGWRLTGVWEAGDAGCRILQFTRPFGLYLSSNTIICISLDRYFAIVQPLKLADARRRGRFMLGCAWLFAVICSLPQAVIFQEYTKPLHIDGVSDVIMWTDCVSDFFRENNSVAEAVYNIFSIYAMYGLPLGITLFAYGRILWEISITRRLKATRQNPQSPQAPVTNGSSLATHDDENSGTSNAQPSRTTSRHSLAAHATTTRIRQPRTINGQSDLSKIERARSRTLKLTILIVSLFIICFTPYAVMVFWYQIDRASADRLDQTVQEALFLFAVSNSILNPYLYGIYSKSLRNEISRSVICQAFRNCFMQKNDHGGSSSDIYTRNNVNNLKRDELKVCTNNRGRSHCPMHGIDARLHLLPREPVTIHRGMMSAHMKPHDLCATLTTPCAPCAHQLRGTGCTIRCEGRGNWSVYTANSSSSQRSLVSEKATNCSLQRVTAACKSSLCPRSDLGTSSFD